MDLIDDHLINKRLTKEVEHTISHLQRYSDLPRSTSPYITAYIGKETMPLYVLDMVDGLNEGLHEAHSDKDEYHIAVQKLPTQKELLYLLYEVSALEFTEKRKLNIGVVLVAGVLAKALEQAMQRVEAFVERELQFSRDASHELRTPVTVIKGAVELLKRKFSNPEKSV